MHSVSRRAALRGLAASVAFFSIAPPARASLARGLSLEELLDACSASVVGVPLASECHFVESRGQRGIVTDTRVRIDEVLAKGAALESEVMVRTLGGVVGRAGERVEGQAKLVRGEACVLFLVSSRAHIDFVAGMAQGHYPLRRDERGLLRLVASHDLPHLLQANRSAVARLVGNELAVARALIHGISR